MKIGVKLFVFTFTCFGLYDFDNLWYEDIFRKKDQHLGLVTEIWNRMVLLIFGIIATLVVPFVSINKAYDWEAEFSLLMAKEDYLRSYYGICILIWLLILSVSLRRSKKKK